MDYSRIQDSVDMKLYKNHISWWLVLVAVIPWLHPLPDVCENLQSI